MKEMPAFVVERSGGEGSANRHERESSAKQLKVRREPENGQLGLLARLV